MVRNAWLSRARYPNRIRHYLGFERGDYEVALEYEIDAYQSVGKSRDGLTLFNTTEARNSISAVRNWNAAASLSKEDFLVAIADDLVPERDWDAKLDTIVMHNLAKPKICTFTDDRCVSLKNFSNDTLLTRHPGMTREAYRLLGYLFPPQYESVGTDLDLLIQALKSGWLLDARSLKFHHSFNQILNTRNELLCGCEYATAPLQRGQSQSLIHKDSKRAKLILESRWGRLWRLISTFSCANKFANSVYAAMRVNQENSPMRLLLSTIFIYVKSKIRFILVKS
jgi:hypothetical protein